MRSFAPSSLSTGFFVCLLLYVSTSGGLAADVCAPADFKNTDFKHLDSFTSYYFIENMDKKSFDDNSTQIHAQAIIPYIDIPVSADYGQMKEQMRQLDKFVRTGFSSETHTTMLHIAWDELGLDAYKACLDGQKDEVIHLTQLAGGNPYDTQIILRLQFYRKKAGAPTSVKIIHVNGDIDGIKDGDLISQGEDYLFTVTRKPGTELKLVVTIDGISEPYFLPEPVKPPMISTRHLTITQIADQPAPSSQLLPRRNEYCISTDDKIDPQPAQGQELVVNSADGLLTDQHGPLGYARPPKVTRSDNQRACWNLDVVAQNRDGAYSGTYDLWVRTISPGQ